MEHTTPDLIALDLMPIRAGASVRRSMGSPAALAAALAALEPDPDALVTARSEQWQEQLTGLEDARQALLDDRPNWLAGTPTVQVMVRIIR
jgi:hypothetical protein